MRYINVIFVQQKKVYNLPQVKTYLVKDIDVHNKHLLVKQKVNSVITQVLHTYRYKTIFLNYNTSSIYVSMTQPVEEGHTITSQNIHDDAPNLTQTTGTAKHMNKFNEDTNL